MINFDDFTNFSSPMQNINNQRLRICKTKLFNLISQQSDIDKIYFLYKGPYKNYHFLINKRDNRSLKHLNGSKDFTEYSHDIDDIHKNVQEYNQNKKLKETKK